ncbi:MAG: DEAD/DEAH box helicase [Planctomycetes bacterium]|nr:DEAD/DEAH box helicase [Planctomycetota bacterium]
MVTPRPRPPSPSSNLDLPLAALRGFGGRRSAAWSELGVVTLGDLLRWPPRRHLRFDPPTAIVDLREGVTATVRATLERKQAGGRRGIVATRLLVADPTGALSCVLFGPRWLAKSFARSEELLLRGTVLRRGATLELKVRGWLHQEALAPANEANGPTFEPHYLLPELIAPRFHRRALRAALERCREELSQPLPAHAAALAGTQRSLLEVFGALHFPRADGECAFARRILALDEAIALQLRLRARRHERPARLGGAIEAASRWLEEYVAACPHRLTGDQQRALADLVGDYQRPTTMARLLSGDVGSGKTWVALFPLIVAARSGRQGALLAPTELLARQHHATLLDLASRLQLPPPELVVAGVGPKNVSASPIVTSLVVGTHRLFSARQRFVDLAAVVVDEQHKFGALQRARLLGKGGAPDLLLVSATPIPRTLAQTLFGHLDPSLLRERPFPNRDVASELLIGDARRTLGARLRAEVVRGGKVFVVCPAIGSGEVKHPRAGTRGRAAAEKVAPWVARELAVAGIAAEWVALLHGRLDSEAKQARLTAFASGPLRVLVATVVIEVGIDVPDATMVVVLDADRFGLAQLHQIRGRVGRRGHPATCLLVSAEPAPESIARLEAFAAHDDGFKLAELDLAQRGPGELLGSRQHGVLGGLYPEALLDPELLDRARAAVAAGVRNSLFGKPFGSAAVATSEAIW